MDFVHDALADGRPFRVLTVVDQWSRRSPTLEVATSMSGAKKAVGREAKLGYLAHLFTENRHGFIIDTAVTGHTPGGQRQLSQHRDRGVAFGGPGVTIHDQENQALKPGFSAPC